MQHHQRNPTGRSYFCHGICFSPPLCPSSATFLLFFADNNTGIPWKYAEQFGCITQCQPPATSRINVSIIIVSVLLYHSLNRSFYFHFDTHISNHSKWHSANRKQIKKRHQKQQNPFARTRENNPPSKNNNHKIMIKESDSFLKDNILLVSSIAVTEFGMRCGMDGH